MKRIISVVLALVILIMSVSAMEDIDVDCDSPGWWNSDICQDWELQDEFDEVTDAITDVEDEVDHVHHTTHRNRHRIHHLEHDVEDNEDDIDDLESTIAKNHVKWSTDDSGLRLSRVIEYLETVYINFIDIFYVSHTELVETNTLLHGDCAGAKTKAYFSGNTETVGTVTYSPNNELGCIEFSTI